MHRRLKHVLLVCLAVGGTWLLSAAAQACPLCSQAIAEEDGLPHAYMYSILFMLAMPPVVFTGIGSVIYMQCRKSTAVDAPPVEQDDQAHSPS
jgi:hypothetical protein